MVAAMLRGGRVQSGVRPFNPFRDLGAVAELIALAFGNTLDPAGQVALAEMRRVARWGPLLWWFYGPMWSGVGGTPGFVWVEEGRVVGNVSLRRALGWGGFLIGNVAVHPDWRGRGIAGGLMEAALDDISAQDGRWVGLEVRADNPVARHLYERLGFKEVGRVLHMLRPAGVPWEGGRPLPPALRRGRSRDGAALAGLMVAVVPEPQRPLLELRAEDYQPGWERALDRWLGGQREVWWVIEEDGALRGAVRALQERGRRPDRLEVLVSPGYGGRFEDLLVGRGMASLRVSKKMVEIMLPEPAEPLVAALDAAGFQEMRVLVQMRLEVARRVRVRR